MSIPLSISTYTANFMIERDSARHMAGFCLSKISLQELTLKKNDFLHAKEQSYFSNFQYPQRQYSYLLGRYCAKHAIATYMHNPELSTILIENGVFQHPVVSYPHKSLQVSITHTNTLGAALAFSEMHPMSIDIENICPIKALVMQTQMTPNEIKRLNLSSNDFAMQMTLLWTVKEALSKVLRCGFMVPFELLSIESVTEQGLFFISSFNNFPQYKATSFKLNQTICSLVYPKNSFINLDVLSIQEAARENLT